MPSSQSPSAEPALSEVAGAPPPEAAGEDPMRRRFVEAARRAEIVALINAATTEAELGRSFSEELCEVFEAEVAFVLDDGGDRGSPRAVGAVGVPEAAALSLLEIPEHRALLKQNRAWAESGEDVFGLGARSAIVAPFRTDENRSAVVGVARLYDVPFDEADRSLVEAVTLAVGQALERIWAHESRDRSAAQQAALVRAAKSMSRSLETTEVLQTLSAEVGRALGADGASAHVGDESDGYVAVGAVGMPDRFIGFRQSPGTGLGGQAVRSGRVLASHDYQAEGWAPPEAPGVKDLRSCLAAPIAWDGRVRGFITAGFNSKRRITGSDVELLEGFTELAGLACANAERHAVVREAAELDPLTGCLNRLAFEDQLTKLIGVARGREEPISLALLDLDGFKAINDLFGHLSGDKVLREVGGVLRENVRASDLVARYGGDEFALILPESDEAGAAPVIDRARTAIRSMDVPGGKLTACVGVAELAGGEDTRQLLGRADDALRDAKGSPGPGSVKRASRRVSMASRSVYPSRAIDPDRRQRFRAIAGDVGLGMARQDDSEAAAAVAAQELRDVLDLETCAVLRLVADGKLEAVVVAGTAPLSPDWLGADVGAVGQSLREKRTILGDRRPQRRRGDLEESRVPEGASSAFELAVPLIISERAWGAIACSAGDRVLDSVDAELASAVADHLAPAIETDDLHDQLTQSMIGTAEALAAAMAAKDSYTADHARSIAELAVEVGRTMDLPESAVQDLRYAGVFHDIGKIAVPDSLINKPGPLTDEEFEVVKKHPVAGAEILAPVPFLYGVRTIVRHAHEHWDGGGYPDGLAGDQIPLGSRVILAVDAYHAMTSDRPYRKAMSHEQALQELRDGAGEQFDPEVVDALLGMLVAAKRPGDAADA